MIFSAFIICIAVGLAAGLMTAVSGTESES